MSVTVRLAAFNVHGWVVPRGCMDIPRFVETIRGLEADVVGLQEVPIPPLREPGCLVEAVAEPLGMTAVPGPTLSRGQNDYGNALLTRFELHSWHAYDLSYHKGEPRGAIEAVLQQGGASLRVLTTHFGLGLAERRFQAKALLDILRCDPATPVAVMGDFNEWLPLNPSVRLLEQYLGKGPAPATFPAHHPILALDRILVRPPHFLTALRVYKGCLKACSDHLPLVADIELAPHG